MKASLASVKQRKKRQFFDTMIKGNNFKYLIIKCDPIKDPNTKNIALYAKTM